MTTDLLTLTAADLADRIRAGEVSAGEVWRTIVSMASSRQRTPARPVELSRQVAGSVVVVPGEVVVVTPGPSSSKELARPNESNSSETLRSPLQSLATRTWKTTFYWLRWSEPWLGAEVLANADKSRNAIDVTVKMPRSAEPAKLKAELPSRAAKLSVYLVARMVDVTKEVIVTVDGKERANSGPVNGFSKPKTLKVDGLEGAQRLILSVTDAGDGNRDDLANWVDGKLYLNGK